MLDASFAAWGRPDRMLEVLREALGWRLYGRLGQRRILAENRTAHYT